MAKRSREDFDPPSTKNCQDSRESTIDLSPPSHSGSSFQAGESSKLMHVSSEVDEAATSPEVMRCSLPPHGRQPISFASFEDYEVHYNQMHVNRCVECRKNFPTPHFLDLHISENHNPLVEVLRDRGEHTYACFVEGCDRKCLTPQKRRMHLIDKHMFPKDYDFFVINDGIDQRSSMLKSGRHRRRSSIAQHKTAVENSSRRRTSASSKMTEDTLTKEVPSITAETENFQAGAMDLSGGATPASIPPDSEMDGIVGAMSSLNFVPPSVSFGRGRGKGGFSKT